MEVPVEDAKLLRVLLDAEHCLLDDFKEALAETSSALFIPGGGFGEILGWLVTRVERQS